MIESVQQKIVDPTKQGNISSQKLGPKILPDKSIPRSHILCSLKTYTNNFIILTRKAFPNLLTHFFFINATIFLSMPNSLLIIQYKTQIISIFYGLFCLFVSLTLSVKFSYWQNKSRQEFTHFFFFLINWNLIDITKIKIHSEMYCRIFMRELHLHPLLFCMTESVQQKYVESNQNKIISYKQQTKYINPTNVLGDLLFCVG